MITLISKQQLTKALPLILVFLIGSFTCHYSLAQDRPYPERLSMLEAIAEIYPGQRDHRQHDYTDLGMWAGIYYQTQWQYNSLPKRSDMILWEAVNRTLTVVPYFYHKELKTSGTIDCDSYADPGHSKDPVSRKIICESWKDFFLASGPSGELERQQQLIWEAHELAISTILVENHADFLNADIPDLEFWFWKGWTKTVSLIAKRNLPSNTDFSKYDGRLPDCVLGLPGCHLSDLPPVQRGYACLHIRLALEKRSVWEESMVEFFSLTAPDIVLDTVLSSPLHCRVARRLLKSQSQRQLNVTD